MEVAEFERVCADAELVVLVEKERVVYTGMVDTEVFPVTSGPLSPLPNPEDIVDETKGEVKPPEIIVVVEKTGTVLKVVAELLLDNDGEIVPDQLVVLDAVVTVIVVATLPETAVKVKLVETWEGVVDVSPLLSFSAVEVEDVWGALVVVFCKVVA